MPQATPAPATPPQAVQMPPGRDLMCAHPECSLLVHQEAKYGGYCCKRCHWHHWRQATESRKTHWLRHGRLCAQQAAPEGALRAQAVPPEEPIDGVKVASAPDRPPRPAGGPSSSTSSGSKRGAERLSEGPDGSPEEKRAAVRVEISGIRELRVDCSRYTR